MSLIRASPRVTHALSTRSRLPLSSRSPSHLPARRAALRSMSSEPSILRTEECPSDAKWLKLQKIHWKDQGGKERIWEVANRKTRTEAGVDSCHILALVKDRKSNETKVVLLKQYRPPAAGVVVEFPAGLIDEGETPEQAALRELYEETGYKAGVSVRRSSPVVVKDPGMTGANMVLVTVDVSVDDASVLPDAHPDEGEYIEKELVPLGKLAQVLQEYAKQGLVIDALVESVATGLSLAGDL